MRLLLVAATQKEIQPTLDALQAQPISLHCFKKDEITCLITGMGTSNTQHILTQHLHQNSYDLAINVGICGAYERSSIIGSTVQVREDVWHQKKLTTHQHLTTSNISLLNLTNVKGVTVDEVSEDAALNQELIDTYEADIESMEGAAFFNTCKAFQQHCMQIRTISNYTGPRNLGEWDIPFAIEKLNQQIKVLLPC